jgi:ABC-type spermidine/putrescine transport system permease subunit I
MMVPCVAFIAAVFLYPVAELLSLSFHNASGFTLAYYARFFGSPVYLEVLWITVKWSVVVTAISLLLGYPVAYLITSVSARIAGVVMLMLAIALAMSLLVRSYAWMVILGQQGIVNSTLMWLGIISRPLNLLNNSFAVVVVMVQVLVPFMILTLAGVMRDIDRTLVVAARTLGANPPRAFFEIFVPLSLPGIGSGCLLVFVMSCGYFVVPALLGGPRDMWMSMLIETQVNNAVDWGFAAALAAILLVLVAGIFYIYERYWGLDRIWGGA